MKTSTIIIAAVLTLQAGILFAGNDNSSAPVTNESATITLAALAPAIPVEATFEEFAAVNEIGILMPLTPVTAEFEDVAIVPTEFSTLAPVTPAAADFE